jgi:hypothetical protein
MPWHTAAPQGKLYRRPQLLASSTVTGHSAFTVYHNVVEPVAVRTGPIVNVPLAVTAQAAGLGGGTGASGPAGALRVGSGVGWSGDSAVGVTTGEGVGVASPDGESAETRAVAAPAGVAGPSRDGRPTASVDQRQQRDRPYPHGHVAQQCGRPRDRAGSDAMPLSATQTLALMLPILSSRATRSTIAVRSPRPR